MDKKTYTPAQKKAIMTYREKNKEAYNEYATDYYQKKKMDEEWKEKFNERCKIANKKMREKKL